MNPMVLIAMLFASAVRPITRSVRKSPEDALRPWLRVKLRRARSKRMR